MFSKNTESDEKAWSEGELLYYLGDIPVFHSHMKV